MTDAKPYSEEDIDAAIRGGWGFSTDRVIATLAVERTTHAAELAEARRVLQLKDEQLRTAADLLAAETIAKTEARAEIARLRGVLVTISQWDSLNPPQPNSDFPWLRHLVDKALAPADGGQKITDGATHASTCAGYGTMCSCGAFAKLQAGGGQKTSEAEEPVRTSPEMIRQRRREAEGNVSAQLAALRSEDVPEAPPRAASGGEAKDANGPPERVPLYSHDLSRGVHPAIAIADYRMSPDATELGDYVRSDLHAAAIARAEATADQFARYRTAARELRKTLEGEVDKASKDRDDLLAALRAIRPYLPDGLTPMAKVADVDVLLARLDAGRDAGLPSPCKECGLTGMHKMQCGRRTE